MSQIKQCLKAQLVLTATPGVIACQVTSGSWRCPYNSVYLSKGKMADREKLMKKLPKFSLLYNTYDS